MKCPQKLLMLHLDRNLNVEDSILVEDHLAQCPECRQEYRQLQQLFAMLKPSPAPEPGEDLLPAIMQAVELEPVPMAREVQRRALLARYIGWASTLIGISSFVLIIYLCRLSLYNLVWNEVVWLWSQVILLGGNLAPNVVSLLNTATHGVRSWLLVLEVFWQNGYLWAAALVGGLCAWTMLREIAADLQRILGYHR